MENVAKSNKAQSHPTPQQKPNRWASEAKKLPKKSWFRRVAQVFVPGMTILFTLIYSIMAAHYYNWDGRAES